MLFLSGGAPRRPMELAEILELAGWWNAHGVAVLPVRLVHNAARDVIAKMPAGTIHGFEDAALDFVRFEAMLEKAAASLEAHEALALGGVPGSAGFAVGDFDTKGGAGGAATLRELLLEYPDAGVCRYRSASGALNCFWRKPHGAPALRNATVPGWYGFELRCDAGFVVLPGAFSPWGAWYFEQGSVELEQSWTLPPELVNRFRAPSRHRTASSPEVEEYLAQRTSDTPATRELVREILEEFQEHAQHGRHPALVRAVGRLVGLDRINLREALEHLQESWDAATAGEGREREVLAVAAWTIGQEREHRRNAISWSAKDAEEREQEAVELDALEMLRGAQGLSDAAWTSRESLRRLRGWARARCVSPDAVLLCAIARVLAHTSPKLQLPNLVGGNASLNFLALLVGPSGVGKSAAFTTSAAALDLAGVEEKPNEYPAGSGEGLAESFFSWVEEEGEDGKKRKAKKQTRTRALFYVDEGQVLSEIGKRTGSVLLPELRKVHTGAGLGQWNAAEEKRRAVPAHAYRLCVVVGIQPAHALAILEDAPSGTPQRFVFASAFDPAHEAFVLGSDPQPWRIEMPSDSQRVLGLPQPIWMEVREQQRARLRGDVLVPELDAHRALNAIHVAAGLMALDGRFEQTTLEDHELAEAILVGSDRVRDSVEEYGRRIARRKEAAQDARSARGAVVVQRAKAADLRTQCLERLEQMLRTAGAPLSWRAVLADLPKPLRAFAADARHELERRGALCEEQIRTEAGRTKRRIRWTGDARS